MFDVQISNRQSLLPVREEALREIAEATLEAEQVQRAEIVVALVDDESIREVNRTHLQHDYATDVISFVYESERPGDADLPNPRGKGLNLDGEVVISAETAVREASQFGWTAENELALYLVHGLLHLCGYDDLTPEEQQCMRARERAILQIWQLTPHYSQE